MRSPKDELKHNIVSSLNLRINPKDIVNEDPLFNEGLGLDSIAALEMLLMLEEIYEIRLDNPEKEKEAFYSVDTLNAFILENQKKK